MDFDDDGKKDVVAGDEEGAVWFFRNVGEDGAPDLAKGRRIAANGKPISGRRTVYTIAADGRTRIKKTYPGSSELADRYSKLHVADWNGDGLKDIAIGHNKGEFLLYYNTGEKGAPEFGQPRVVRPKEGSFPSRPSPFLVDWDGDGKRDLLVGSESGEVHFFPNRGTDETPRFDFGEPLKAGGDVIQCGHRARIEVVDWNNDGTLDLLVGNYYSIRPVNPDDQWTSGGNVWLYLGERR